MNIGDIVFDRTADLVTVPPTASLATALAILKASGGDVLAVCDRWGRLVGLVSAHDLDQAAETPLPEASVAMVMRRDVQTCTTIDAIQDVVARMRRDGLTHMPVVDAGEVVSMVSIGQLAEIQVKGRDPARIRDDNASGGRGWTLMGWRLPSLGSRG